MKEPLLVVDGVSVAFGGVQALSNVSFDVREGEIFALIGPNGAGKTTLFNVISGVLRPDRGDVRFAGRSIVGRPPHRIAQAGIARTYQVVRPFGRLSVVDNVAVGALVHAPTIARARSDARGVVEFVGLGPLADRPASSLTLTQRKRLEVARALALRPKLILLDEVMAGLTPTEMDGMAEFVVGLHERGIAAVAGVEHVMRLVMRILAPHRRPRRGTPHRRRRPGRDPNEPGRDRGVPRRAPIRRMNPSTGPGQAVLRVDALEASYGDFRALHGVSFAVGAGEIVSVIGANGAGKSTSLKSVMGIVRPSAGTIVLDGERIDGRAPRAIVERGIALVPEGRNLFPDMTVEENLLVGAHVARARGGTRRRLSETYARFPTLGPLRARSAGALSGGQQQIVAIARALMSQPRILLMDEPSLGLAPKTTLEIFGVVRDVNRAGVAVVLVEQNAVQALDIASRAYVLAEGATVMEGTAAAIRGDADVKRRYLGEV